MSFNRERQAMPEGGAAQEPTTQELTLKLQEVLSTRLTAFITLRDVEDPNLKIDAGVVRQWAAGEVEPSDTALDRLRSTYRIVHELMEVEEASTVCGWFLGMNPYLFGESPALMIAVDPQEVHNAARAYIADSY